MRGFGRAAAAAVVASLPLASCDCGDSGGFTDVTPRLELDGDSHDFGETPKGMKRSWNLKLSNKGYAPVTITRFSLDSPTGEITVDKMPDSVGANQIARVSVSYEPADVGLDTALIEIDADDGLGLRSVSLSGTGVTVSATIAVGAEECAGRPGSASFGDVRWGQTRERRLMLRATGSKSIHIKSIAIEPSPSEWTVDSLVTLDQEIRPGEAYAVVARYRPEDAGSDSSNLVIKTDSWSQPVIELPLCGRGLAPAVCASPVPLALGVALAGTTTASALTLESCGTEPLSIETIDLARDPAHPTDAGFALGSTPALPALMPPGHAVQVEVRFTPGMSTGRVLGWLRVASNAAGSPESFVPLDVVVPEPCTAVIEPSPLRFHSVPAGGRAERKVAITNLGERSCLWTRAQIGAGAAQMSLRDQPALPIAIGPGDTEVLALVYQPGATAGPHQGRLDVVLGGRSESLDLLGNPAIPPGCALDAVPAVLTYGLRPIDQDAILELDLINVGDAECRTFAPAIELGSSPDFQTVSPAPIALAPGGTTKVPVRFRPRWSRPARGVLLLVPDAGTFAETLRVPLYGRGVGPNLCVEPRRVSFGTVSVGSRKTLDFDLTACGAGAVTVQQIAWTSGDGELRLGPLPRLPLVLPRGSTRRMSVTYVPADEEPDRAAITVASDDPVSPMIEVEVTGGGEIVPPASGQFLYFWRIQGMDGAIWRAPLQGPPVATEFWGPANQRPCTGCHNVSPDGRYVALGEPTEFLIVDAQTRAPVTPTLSVRFWGAFMSWRPDVNAQPAYQFAYESGDGIHIASIASGYVRQLTGTFSPGVVSGMPSWGPNGKIAFVRGANRAYSAYMGPCDIMTVDEDGGTPVALAGASGNSVANYYPEYSPNGRWIAFTVSPSAVTTMSAADAELRLVAADGSGTVRRLPGINSMKPASYPTWSIDGRYVSYSSTYGKRPGDWDIFIAPIDPNTGLETGSPRNVVELNTNEFEHTARWAP